MRQFSTLIPYFISILLIFSCSSRDKQAIAIIEKSIEAHGGMNAWQDVQSIAMVRDIWMFDEAGNSESYIRQKNEFRFKPFFEAKMNWERDSILHRVHFDGVNTRYLMGENEIQNEGFLQSKKRDMDAAFYVLTKPFDLLDESKYIEYIGSEELPGGVSVETVKVIDGDPSDPGTDIWWYYFDPKSFEIMAYKVKTSDHHSLVYNQGWDKTTGLLFPARRESYRVDVEGSHLYQRAIYEYGTYEVTR
jgi:hypothetical protein